MPNWVYNTVIIEGSKEDIVDIKKQLNSSFTREHDSFNPETGKMEMKTYTFDNPIFSFWNIIRPTDMEAYNKQPDHTSLSEALKFDGDHWYDWNIRNWGTKWDVAVSNNDKYPDTGLDGETEDILIYTFNTAWSAPHPALLKLSEQYPDCKINLSYEEETGWGGETDYLQGGYTDLLDYDNRCRDCDSINTMEYCENDCGEICSNCNYLGEAELDVVAECDVHKIYLDSKHVPDYRMEEIQ